MAKRILFAGLFFIFVGLSILFGLEANAAVQATKDAAQSGTEILTVLSVYATAVAFYSCLDIAMILIMIYFGFKTVEGNYMKKMSKKQ